MRQCQCDENHYLAAGVQFQIWNYVYRISIHIRPVWTTLTGNSVFTELDAETHSYVTLCDLTFVILFVSSMD